MEKVKFLMWGIASLVFVIIALAFHRRKSLPDIWECIPETNVCELVNLNLDIDNGEGSFMIPDNTYYYFGTFGPCTGNCVSQIPRSTVVFINE